MIAPPQTTRIAALLLAAALAIYAPVVGAGFIKDDFAWVRRAEQIVEQGDWTPLVRRGDFFRPVVTASFAVNYAMCGTSPACYGWTNLGLALLAAVLVAGVGRHVGLSIAASGVAAGLWFFNWHGINMAVLWVSGRTALLLIIFSLLATGLALRRRWGLASVCVLLALGSKEEAVLLPVMVAAVAWSQRERKPMPSLARVVVWLGWPLLAYVVLRSLAGALTPGTAPDHYRFVFSPAQVLQNIAEYADRSTTLAAIALLGGWLLARRTWVLGSSERAIVWAGVPWLLLGFAITVWLPVRSSLYACFPSVGSAWVAAGLLTGCWRAMSIDRQRLTAIAGAALLVLVVPLHITRNTRLVGEARLSTQAMEAMVQAAGQVPDQGLLWVTDEREARVNLDGAFGSLIDDAVALRVGRGVRVWIEPPLTDLAAAGVTAPTQPSALRLRLRDGVLAPER